MMLTILDILCAQAAQHPNVKAFFKEDLEAESLGAGSYVYVWTEGHVLAGALQNAGS